MVLITSLSLFSFESIDDVDVDLPNFDKVVHFSFHLGIVVLGALASIKNFSNAKTVSKNIWIVLLFSFSYGILIEVLQYVMPYGRQADIFDIMANVSGAVMGGLLIKKYRLRIDKLK